MYTATTLWHRLDRCIDDFVPGALRASGDEDALRRARLTLWFSLILLTMAGAWGILNSLFGLTVTLPFLAGGAVIVGLTPLTLRRSVVLAAHQVTSALLLVVLGIAWFRGKQEAPLIAWLVLCPLIATLTGGKRTGVVWLGVVAGSLVAMTLFGRAEAAQSNISKVWIARPLTLFTLAVATQSCAVVYEAMRDRMLSQLRRMYAELEQRHRESEQQLHEISLLNGRLAAEHKAARDVAASLEIARAAAEAANQAKGRFLANVSHELRTPMNAVIGTTEWLLDEGLPDAQRAKAHTILSAGHSLLAIINDVLDMSKIEAGELRLHSADFNIAEVIESMLGPMRVLAEAKGLKLCAEIDRLPREMLHGDELRLRQVLVNLIGNAIKFTHEGSVTLRIASVHCTEASARLHFSVCDTGIGMDEEALGRVFSPFEQADESTTRRFGGTGLGLSIATRLVALMGGALTVRTAQHQGSTFEFTVELGFAAVPRQAEVQKPAVYAAERLRARAPHVLVAEDNAVNRILLERVLVQLGCRVELVPNGAQAVAQLTQAHTFDIVFMDWHMPELDGLNATANIRAWERAQRRPPIRIIGFTASAFDDEVARCREAGMNDVLTKPIVRAQVEQKLHEYLLGCDSSARTQ